MRDENPSGANVSERRSGFERTMPVNHGLFHAGNPEEDFCTPAQRERSEGNIHAVRVSLTSIPKFPEEETCIPAQPERSEVNPAEFQRPSIAQNKIPLSSFPSH